MANKQNFSPDELTKVLESVILAILAITASEPSGVWGTLMETFAGGSALAASKVDPGSNELVKAIISDFETTQGRFAVQEALRKGLGVPSQARLSSVHSPICGRSPQSSMPKHQTMLRRLRPGCVASVSESPRRRRKAVS